MWNEAIEKYIVQNSSPHDELLAALERETHLKTMAPRMLSGEIQGKVLTMVSKMIAPTFILEIGTFTGYSALCLAKGLTPQGRLFTIETDPEILHIPRSFFQKSEFKDQIELLHGNALEIIPKLPFNFDLVFIDADKENYLAYYKMLIDKLPSKAIILADNVLWSGKIVEDKKDKKTASLHEFNEYVSQDDRVENIILPIRDGINLIRKK